MNSLVVLFALVAAAVAAPAPQLVAYQQPAYVVPSAVSSQSRVDVHSSPAVYAAGPVVTEYAGAPAFYAANNFYGTPGYYAPSGLVPQQYVAPGFVPQTYVAPGTVLAY